MRALGQYWFVGALAFATDWLCFVALSALGVPIWAANLLSRIAGAGLSFQLNGRLTFPDGSASGRRQLARFVIVWIGLTAVSTLAVSRLDMQIAWIVKPALDICLAMAGFLISKHWIYR